jgi:hypothetical protein
MNTVHHHVLMFLLIHYNVGYIKKKIKHKKYIFKSQEIIWLLLNSI